MRETPSLNAAVHKELSAVPCAPGDCCVRTELVALLAALGPAPAGPVWRVGTNNVLLAQRLLSLIRAALGRDHPVLMRKEPSRATPGRHRVTLLVARATDGPAVLELPDTAEGLLEEARAAARRQACCAAALLRAAYWKGGYVSSPRTGFHFELVVPSGWPVEAVLEATARLGADCRAVTRRGREVVYLKDAETLSDLLGRLGAKGTLLLLQDVVITKEIKNGVNRSVNCEVGNLRRLSASVAADVAAMRFLKKRRLLNLLPERLRDVGEARCRHPSLNLAELGRLLEPPLSKAGVHHRLRELRTVATREKERIR